MKTPSPQVPTEVQSAITIGNGMFPPGGTYSLAAWALIVGRDEQTIRRWIKLYNIRHRNPGDQIWIEAEEMWNKWPLISGKPKPSKK